MLTNRKVDKEGVITYGDYLSNYIPPNGILIIKNNEILAFMTIWMDLESITIIEISHTEKDKTNQKQTHRCRKETGGYQRGLLGFGRQVKYTKGIRRYRL